MTDADLWHLAKALYPLPRTVQGPAVLQTLDLIDHWISTPPEDCRCESSSCAGEGLHECLHTLAFPLHCTEVPVGTKVFDWTVLPDAENRRAYHPTLDEVPAYDGPLTYAEAVIPGASSQEVLLSTYTCHPSMANDNVSGMVVTAALIKWLASAPRRYTYRALFAPETIGALCWLDAHRQTLISIDGAPRQLTLDVDIVAGFTINNCGDERAWSFIPSRNGDTLADRAALHTLRQKWIASATHPLRPFLDRYSFADRGSDERQFCAPGIDLPVASVMRSKHGTYPEYHTKADDLSVISPKGLGDSFRCYQRIIETIEANRTYRVTTIGEPMLSKYGLYPSGTKEGPNSEAVLARNICATADGQTDLIAISDFAARPIWDVAPMAAQLAAAGVLR